MIKKKSSKSDIRENQLLQLHKATLTENATSDTDFSFFVSWLKSVNSARTERLGLSVGFKSGRLVVVGWKDGKHSGVGRV